MSTRKANLLRLSPRNHAHVDICAWAEENIIVAASATPGRLRLYPYQRDILEAMADPDVRQVTLMVSSQIGKTLLSAILLAYFIDVTPNGVLFIHVTQSGLKKFLREKFEPILRGNLRLNEKIIRNNRGTLPIDGFPFIGGYATLSTSAARNNDRGTTAQLIIGDEVSDWLDPKIIAGLRQRTITHTDPKVILISTPKYKGDDGIELNYLKGSQEVWHDICFHCNQPVVLEWSHINKATAEIICPVCNENWSEAQRISAISKGYWESQSTNARHRSFHLSQLNAVNIPLQRTVEEAAKFTEMQISTQIMAQPFEEIEIAPLKTHQIQRTDEPFDAYYRTAGVDVQKDRLEYVIVEFTESLNFKRIVAHGSISRTGNELEHWANLRAALAAFKTVQKVSIDGGYMFDHVVSGIKKHFADLLTGDIVRVEIVRGSTISTGSFDKALRMSQGRTDIFPFMWVATDEAKLQIAQDLASGHMKINNSVARHAEKHLTSEKLIRKQMGTKDVRRWVKVTPDARNEILDCVVYACAGVLDLVKAVE